MTKALSTTLLALALAVPGTAKAQPAPSPSSCPPGSGFCAEPPQEQAEPGGGPVQRLAPLPNPDQSSPTHSPPPPPPPYPPPPPPQPPPAVVYQPPPGTMVIRPERPPPYVIAGPPYGPPPSLSEWGLNLHIEGVGIGRGTGGSAAMGGGGAGLRFKPTRRFGIEADLDFVGGTDYQGLNRSEAALTFNGLFFVNPRSRAQVYFLAGFGWAGAHVSCDPGSVSCPDFGLDQHYGYFGGQLGGGLELRLARAIAFNADLRGFIRTRTDDLARVQPEFVDAYGRTTNTSGGALLTGGMTLYF
jgi:Outer membrane protein beta-barrel domain